MSDPEVESSEFRVESGRGGGAPPDSQLPSRRAWRRFRKNRPAVFSAWFLAVLLLVIVAWPIALKIAGARGGGSAAWAKTYAPEQLSDAQFEPPGARHWFGTDAHGREVLSRVLFGAQISLLVGVVGAAVSLVIGVLWGSIAGFAGGRVDSAMMRFVAVLYCMPAVIIAIVLMTA